ncbi:hypothetical protein O5190_27585, partial [Escherichia coli]|nr:hypothetical protein [Escherichia coli]
KKYIKINTHVPSYLIEQNIGHVSFGYDVVSDILKIWPASYLERAVLLQLWRPCFFAAEIP